MSCRFSKRQLQSKVAKESFWVKSIVKFQFMVSISPGKWIFHWFSIVRFYFLINKFVVPEIHSYVIKLPAWLPNMTHFHSTFFLYVPYFTLLCYTIQLASVELILFSIRLNRLLCRDLKSLGTIFLNSDLIRVYLLSVFVSCFFLLSEYCFKHTLIYCVYLYISMYIQWVPKNVYTF